MLTWNNILQEVCQLKTLHNSKIEKALQFGLTLQPYIVIFDSTEIFTVVNNIYFKLETPLKALDICSKTFFSGNLHR